MDWALDQISQHREMWPQVELQEHRAVVRPLEKVDAPQEGRLPRAARPEYAERAPRGDREIHAAEHTKQTEALAEVPDLHDGSARVAALTHAHVPARSGPCAAPSIRSMSRSASREQRRRAWPREARNRWTAPGWP